jgi:hypothetical protein
MVAGAPKFCQVWSFFLLGTQAEQEEEWKRRAEQCDNWTPNGVDRSTWEVPHHERWYEKDSMA